MQFFSSSGGTSTLRHLPVHASAERGADAWSLPLHSPLPGENQSCSGVARAFPGGRVAHPEGQNEEENSKVWGEIRKQLLTFEEKLRKVEPLPTRECEAGYGLAVLDLPLFVISTIHVLLLFMECASRLELVGLNKYFWHTCIYKVTMTCFTTRHIQRGG